MDRRKYYNSMHCVIKVTNSTRTKIDPLCYVFTTCATSGKIKLYHFECIKSKVRSIERRS